eukprot:CAMPEP_0119003918 /NCGR_PEP_ID=MMETSP1176-20130426/843_1 /TAXON_ID=265551 /ORGANISM="Synedropsis recta cf, Strain CCMP1620" /LENGTH=79 /DNA_ID=CAMNT_0006955565 /DNA_START=152 /DNA_END=391 /DNA_ORIENTATION=+
MNKQTGRTVVRDPRKKSVPAVVQHRDDDNLPAEQQQYHPPLPLPMQPQGQQQPGLGSMVLMGAGVSMGFALVGALFGGF